MIEVEMYGVIHGTENAGPLHPSHELVEVINMLPKRSKVGIEFTPDLPQLSIRNITIDRNSWEYWIELAQICMLQPNSLQVIYLDDVESYKRVASCLARAGELNNQMSVALHRGPVASRDFWDYRRRIYRAQLEGQLVHEVIREHRVFKKIQETEPDLVILGKAHADIWQLSGQTQSRSGIVARDFRTEVLPSGRYERIGKLGEPEKGLLIERRILARKYNVLKHGRMLPAVVPSHIGVFQYDAEYTPEEGYFEVFTGSGNQAFQGHIYDTLGTARFTGSISDTEVNFEKEYIAEESIAGASFPLPYSGQFDSGGGFFVGNFDLRWSRGMFILAEYSPGFVTKAFMNRSIDIFDQKMSEQ